jgi:lipid-binding SYLF domain-containing protein
MAAMAAMRKQMNCDRMRNFNYQTNKFKTGIRKDRTVKMIGKMMMKVAGVAAIAGVMMYTPMVKEAMAADSHEKQVQRLAAARNVLDEIQAAPDKSIPAGILQKAYCVAVVPSFIKGAFIIGGDYGKGVVTCRTPNGWSAPVFIQMSGGSFGFQIGGQGTDLVLVAINENGLNDLLKNKFKIGGDASAAAGPVGRDAEASTDILMNAELLTWSRAKGLFAGIALDGTVVNQDSGDTQAFYGVDYPFERILHGGVPVPPDAQPFVRTVAKYFVRSHD